MAIIKNTNLDFMSQLPNVNTLIIPVSLAITFIKRLNRSSISLVRRVNVWRSGRLWHAPTSQTKLELTVMPLQVKDLEAAQARTVAQSCDFG
jgi:hypothetical protein